MRRSAKWWRHALPARADASDRGQRAAQGPARSRRTRHTGPRLVKSLTSSVSVRRLGQVAVDARFVDQKDVESIVRAVIVASFVLVVGLFLLAPGKTDPPRGVIALDFLIAL